MNLITSKSTLTKKLERSTDFKKFLKSKYKLENNELYINAYGKWRQVISSKKVKYEVISVSYNGMKCSFKKHRIVFFIANGYFPMIIDHLDRNTKNNNPENLKACTLAENRNNTSGIKVGRGTSKYVGVCWKTNEKKWAASIKIKYKTIGIGYFDDEIKAAKARDEYLISHNLLNNYSLNFPRHASA